MIPVSNFIYTIQGLTLTLTDQSEGIPLSWAWDFGDGNTSNIQNPIPHVYSAPGNYVVSLEVTNTDGLSLTTKDIIIYPLGVFIIDDIIVLELPTGFVIDTNYTNLRKKYWQIYLQVLIDPHIPDQYIQDENYWPSLVNMLIAQLVIFDYTTKLANDAMISILNSTGGVEGSSITNLKRMEMGPSIAEWYDSADTLKKLFGEGSSFERAQQQVCSLARRLKIPLPYCPRVSNLTIIPGRVGKPLIPTGIQYLQAYIDKYPQ